MTRTCTVAISSSMAPGCCNSSPKRKLPPRHSLHHSGHTSRREFLNATSLARRVLSTVEPQRETRRAAPVLFADNLDRRRRAIKSTRRFAPASCPVTPLWSANNFFRITSCQPENFLNFPTPPYNRPRISSLRTRRRTRRIGQELPRRWRLS